MNIIYKRQNHFLIALCFLFAVIVSLLLLSACSPQSDSAQKDTQTISSLWPTYSLEEAINAASTIVYGKVSSKSDTLVHESITSSGTTYNEYYKEVTIDVISMLKGSEDAATVTYCELGGEMGSKIYVYEGFDIVQEGDYILAFLGDTGAFISPDAFFILDGNSNISVVNTMLPEAYEKNTTVLRTTMAADDFISLIDKTINK